MPLRNNVTTVLSPTLRSSSRQLILLIGFLLIFFGSYARSMDASHYLILIGAFVLALGITFEMLVYLQDSRRRFIRARAFADKEAARSATHNAIDDPLNQVFREFSRLEKEKGDVTSIEKLWGKANENFHLTNIRGISERTQKRLAEEVNALGSRANIQLSIGIFISLIGLSVLGYFVFTIPANLFVHGNETEFVGYFVTRLSLVLFIEVFAYFFLRLYRYSIFEIKHFQNEMTNAEFRVIALEAALMGGDKPTLKKLCEELSRTERNFILKKGEKTIIQTSLDIEAERDASLLTTVEGLIRNINQNMKSKAEKGTAAP